MAVNLDVFGTYIYPFLLLPVGTLIGVWITLGLQRRKARQTRNRIAALPEPLLDLAIKYEAFNEVRDLQDDATDRDNRVKLKDRTFAHMKTYAMRQLGLVDKAVLSLVGREGCSVLLFAAVIEYPDRGDPALICATKGGLLNGNAQHKAVDAVVSLFGHPELVPSKERADLLAWLDGIPNKEAGIPKRITRLRETARL